MTTSATAAIHPPSPSVAQPPPDDDVLRRLEQVSATRGVASLAERLAELREWIGGDLLEVEQQLREVDHAERTPAVASARHLLGLEGKRLRPLCVALAARVGGGGFTDSARQLAVAVELVHNATLLHDDVVDLGDRRRGVDTARVIYGNAASIFGGDWLLVEALHRIRRTGLFDVLDRALGVLREMLIAESLQLQNRGTLGGGVPDYFRVVEGKTASLFRWALFAGGRAGGAAPEVCVALESFGQKLGVAFQVIDDVLDVSGDPGVVGKSVFADLREGKMTYPLLLAVERDRALGPLVEQSIAHDGAATSHALDPVLERRVALALRETRAVDDCLALARRLSAEAIGQLAAVPAGRARDALENVALSMLQRRK